MSISEQDISIVLSGGVNNINPNLSLGGDPSITPIGDNIINNLFSDVSPDQAASGSEDYRCFYFFNDSEQIIYNIKIWIESEVEGGSNIEMGIEEVDELQRMTVSVDTPASGKSTWRYETYLFDVLKYDKLEDYVAAFENSLNTLGSEADDLLETVSVSTPSSLGQPTIILDILFGDKDGKRNHEAIVLVVNDYIPPSVTLTLNTIQQGAPINTLAPVIVNEFTAPGGVNFFVPSEQSPINLYKLRPAEGFPIWIKRITSANSTSVAGDGARIRFKLETIKPPS